MAERGRDACMQPSSWRRATRDCWRARSRELVGRIVALEARHLMQAPARSGEAAVRRCEPSSGCREQLQGAACSACAGVGVARRGGRPHSSTSCEQARGAAGRAVLVVFRRPNTCKTAMGGRAEGVCGYSRCSTPRRVPRTASPTTLACAAPRRTCCTQHGQGTSWQCVWRGCGYFG